jgi:hypothetical protein
LKKQNPQNQRKSHGTKPGSFPKRLNCKTEAVEEPVWKRPPASWKKDYHEDWSTADARMKEYAYQREEQMKAGYEPLKAKAQFADKCRKWCSRTCKRIQGLGIDAPRAVKALLEADHALRYSTPEQKLQLFGRLAQQYGVNLGQYTGFATTNAC